VKYDIKTPKLNQLTQIRELVYLSIFTQDSAVYDKWTSDDTTLEVARSV
jgi:hypothetical protein